MDFLICLVGPSGSGKTTVAHTLQNMYGYNAIDSYTTRCPRHENEGGHIFVSVDDWIKAAIDTDKTIIAYTNYNGHHYWMEKDQYKNKGISVYVVDVYGLQMLKDVVYDAQIVVIVLYSDTDVRCKRMDKRDKNNSGQALYRIENDNKVFSVIPCDYFINTTNKTIKDIAKDINKIVRKII